MATDTRRRKEEPTAEEKRDTYLEEVRDMIVEQTIDLMKILRTPGGIANEKRDIALAVTALSLSVAIEEGWPLPASEKK